MKFFLPAFLALTLLISSCSSNYQHVYLDRSIANEALAPLNVDQLMTIKSSSNFTKDINYIQKRSDIFLSAFIHVEFVSDPTLPPETAFKILPTIENQKHKVKILFSHEAFYDRNASNELLRFYDQLIHSKFVSEYSIFELYYNAKSQDFLSLQALAKLRYLGLTDKSYNPFGDSDLTSLYERRTYWANIQEQFEKQETLYKKKIKIKTEARKSVMDALDKVSDDQQFRNLIARNDRKGAAKLLRSYLPWEHMPPFEKLFWETHLDVMVNPLPLDQRVLVYRGIDGDIIQTGEVAGKKLSRTEAILDQKVFLMSTMMSKNQGTWNRRLRSLNTMYDKYMGTDKVLSSEYTKSARISNMFFKHAEEPSGSPFLSYSPSFKIASAFGKQTNTAYFVDPRLMYFNFASRFPAELEFLIPLASFPEDLAAVYDYRVQTDVDPDEVEKFLRKTAIEKIEREMGAGKGEEIFERIVKNSSEFFTASLDFKSTNPNPHAAITKAHAVDDFVKTISDVLKDDPEQLNEVKKSALETYEALEKESAAQELANEIAAMNTSKAACKDLIQLFWK
ncbi:hypothetical protein SHI21_08890 [Bacteriovorax sp. PP10]|uniref:Lipoprotein n=1 Tax=Bacteriovorax antarcticus TaxID=3088717 RepID=A0ABU5VTD4_9BACT|nr:hypothetical protein [Bacteriovorax sp. PP10]MEA9356316.1 hypothetical protein [Bacteriovorax sp. PP10]